MDEGGAQAMATLVLNLATGEEQTYTTAPIEALITAAIMGDKRTGDINNPLTRERYRKMVIYGRWSASIGDFAVRTDGR
jgi:hypothetical protein